ncbi:MAG: hypothetical protein F6K50_35800 [Moorea sp. SIO3I7]|uniref:Uncharacterized protein n=1 Tax=Moorena bouillonii PNG TaxID=568701 RepID=A0A1U7N836_9CYAN|nr:MULTISPECIES: hypothetical protein [Moorena]NEO00618.1 hypothetical protein [Moorena sp. SIO3I7]NEO08144.1 hypothetical protein [Moorena sp. SIO3I8]NEO18138.1 hypothetical protein [Moorena sp. SIO4A5]NEP23555.1 hypothetical protein [Moorena sp. SIO3I6]NEQ57565.1 hypothetical protein [Moorena sp. SIO4A1]
MKKNQDYQKWLRTVTKKMPHLSKPQAEVLGMWSFGIVMTGSCGLTTVAVFLAALLGKKENTVRQQLREWYRNQQDKKGDKRAELDVTSCASPTPAMGVKWMASPEKIDGFSS